MNLAEKVKSGLKWSASSKLIGQLITWGLTIYVMRLLEPKDYGLLAMAMIFVSFLILLKEFGLGPAIVQSNEITQRSLQQIFAVLILVNILLLLFIIAAAPFIAAFFREPQLEDILKVLAIQFLLIPFETIPFALLQKSMRFKSLAAVELVSAIVGGVSTFSFATFGFGVWSLIYGALALSFTRVLFLNIFSFWFKFPIFTNLGEIKKFVKFGGLVTLDQMLWFFYSQADSFIVGRVLGSKMLGFYSVAMHLSSLPMQKLNSIINQVALPAFSNIQGDKLKVQESVSKSIQFIAFLSFPMFFGIAAVAEHGILLVLGEKWGQSVLPMVILSLIMPFRMISNLIPTVLRGCGRADISVVNLVISAVIMPISLYVGSFWGLKGVCYAWLLAYPVTFAIGITRAKVVTQISFLEILLIVRSPAIISTVMLASIWLLKQSLQEISVSLALAIEVAFGVIVYVSILYSFDRNSLKELLSIVKS